MVLLRELKDAGFAKPVSVEVENDRTWPGRESCAVDMSKARAHGEEVATDRRAYVGLLPVDDVHEQTHALSAARPRPRACRVFAASYVSWIDAARRPPARLEPGRPRRPPRPERLQQRVVRSLVAALRELYDVADPLIARATTTANLRTSSHAGLEVTRFG